jgi:hypothetical protein
MKLEIKKDVNYSASYVTIKNVIPIEGKDRIQHTTIFGNYVIVGKDVKVGDKGIFFPVECRIAEVFLKSNNLYRHKEKNSDETKTGFFEDTGRVRCIKLGGARSEGFFVPLSMLSCYNVSEVDFEKVEENTNFDTVDGIELCRKYRIVHQHNSSGNKNTKKSKIKISKLLPNQFRLHINTEQLARNIHKIKEDQHITISQKIHGSSFIVSNVLCKRKLSLIDLLLLKLGIKIQTTEYDNVYSSRKVVKNPDINKNANHYYSEDIWGVVNKELEQYLDNGLTLYGEVVGYLSDGGWIQKGYDYGCKEREHKNFIYRITYTSASGNVYEFSLPQVKMWCERNNLNCVPILYQGTVKDLYDNLAYKYEAKYSCFDKDLFLKLLYSEYLDKECKEEFVPVGCIHDVPDEGIVLRIEDSLDIEVMKYKSPKFLRKETEDLDKGETNIEDNQDVLL